MLPDVGGSDPGAPPNAYHPSQKPQGDPELPHIHPQPQHDPCPSRRFPRHPRDRVAQGSNHLQRRRPPHGYTGSRGEARQPLSVLRRRVSGRACEDFLCLRELVGSHVSVAHRPWATLDTPCTQRLASTPSDALRTRDRQAERIAFPIAGALFPDVLALLDLGHSHQPSPRSDPHVRQFV